MQGASRDRADGSRDTSDFCEARQDSQIIVHDITFVLQRGHFGFRSEATLSGENYEQPNFDNRD